MMSVRGEGEAVDSLWAITAGREQLAQTPLIGDRECDALIIGAGLAGLSTALAAAGSGARTLVLEAATVGWGASGRNNGQVIPCLSRSDPEALIAAFGERRGTAFVELVRDSAQEVFDLVRRHGIECDAVQNGWLQPAHRASRLAVSSSRCRQWLQHGAPVSLLDAGEIHRATGSGYWHGGWFNPSGGHLNPLAFSRGLARAAVEAGAQLYCASPALSLERKGADWVATTPRGRVRARRVLIATNAYSTPLWPGLVQSIVPVRCYQLATPVLPDAVFDAIMPADFALSDTHGDLYFCRRTADRRLVTGGALLLHHNARQRLGQRIRQRMEMLFPPLAEMGDWRFEHFWQGDLAMTADALPHVHELADGLFAWMGCNGRGVALATALGRPLAQALTGTPLADLPLPLAPLRPIALHAVARRVAPWMLLPYRLADERD
ncbi:NAD(P)/FAD-dependent oxidoreductase [Paludibacterium yongneupense]|uniref:NAD(P)/FAD-dependent oxidoreductase n=1 Tax=Paludibacterium yongneupense TaxID=400061 RepID=UPI000688D08F|nr:FAD-dependent oxidoreductase [Paludibacterium yongneupense]